MKWALLFLIINVGLSIPVAVIPRLLSSSIEPVIIMGVFSLLLAIDLVLIAIQSGVLKPNRHTHLEQPHFYILGIGIAISCVSMLALFSKG